MVKKNLKIILMRHSQSYYNNLSHDFHSKGNKNNNIPEFKYSYSELINDSKLTETGISQSKLLIGNKDFENIKYVFVSPLARCWETFLYSFNNYDNINKVIICPNLREWLSSQNDIPLKIDQFINNKLIKNKIDDYFLKDYDYKNNNLWIFELMEFRNSRIQINNIIKNKFLSDFDKLCKILEFMKNSWPHKIETLLMFNKRVTEMMIEINSYLVLEDIENNVFINDNQVLIITHYEIIKFLTGKTIDNGEYVSYILK